MSQEELARELKVSAKTISRCETSGKEMQLTFAQWQRLGQLVWNRLGVNIWTLPPIELSKPGLEYYWPGTRQMVK